MKEKLDNIKKIIRDNSKIIVPAIVAIVLLVVLFITLYFYKYNSYHKDEELDFYHYVAAVKEDFKAVLSRNRDNEVISLDIKDKDMVIDSYPIYNNERDLVIFPSKMSVVYASNELIQNRVNEYSYLYYDKNDYKLIDKDFNDSIKHTFLYDGSNLYFFLDEVTLKVGKEEIKLSPLSFVLASPNNSVSYYDKESDTARIIDTTLNEVVVSNDYYKINVMQDKLDYFGNVVLLINDLEFLNNISEKE